MKKWIIGVVILAVVAGAAYLVVSRSGLGASATAATPEPIGDLPPVKASDEVVAEAVVVPARSANLSLSTGGIVAEVFVAEGDQVGAGQVLLRLDASQQAAAVAQAEAQLRRVQSALAEVIAGPRPEEIGAAQAAVEVAQAQLARVQQGARSEEIAAAKASLAAAWASLQKLREGPGEGELVAARADVANAEATLRQAQAAYDRVKSEPNITARPESLQLEQATNAYEAAKARLKALQEGPSGADVAAAQAQIDQAQAGLDALKAPARSAEVAAAEAEIQRAQAQLDLLLAGARPETIAAAEAEVAAAEAALEQAQVALAETELQAPLAGTVASLDAKVGEQVAPGAPIVVLADLSAWQIETDDLTELNVVRVHEGDPVTVTFDAVPDLELPGLVVRIEAIGKDKMGDITYTVIIQPDRFDERLRWNMTASVVIEPQ
ncbi:MAG: biotin/lipoyl-binding protein [Anaerolineae bacterium]|jgi:multidrug efflux pump subunit AcrA (membrane-fusion protein)